MYGDREEISSCRKGGAYGCAEGYGGSSQGRKGHSGMRRQDGLYSSVNMSTELDAFGGWDFTVQELQLNIDVLKNCLTSLHPG